MQKTLVISLSSIFFTLPLSADVTSIETQGFFVTKECLQKGEFTECPLEQLSKISVTNPFLLFRPHEVKTLYTNRVTVYQKEEDKSYILDISEIDKSKIDRVAFKNNMIVTGKLLEDKITIKVTDISPPPPPRTFRTSGVL
ncbi:MULTISPECIES: hypothetical protein [unclassified Sulfuricurvum]|uniref:hypothetical protein n=1 Tax=unclassified Sulfuricurvum TaxID=2632390 RepID=UPI0008C8A397|nr:MULTISPECIES: hypothetical protein [unclassified Sulfuricurvum]OHD85609.1 MAG: hypothetical protein A3I60_05735 [Sulfuricurvum sp. RIFCSPLOWO2_02_FULL_43_45]OHD89784.1 MAG: hypothetical protein A3G19_01565 [Sulfuricurvum sp. RIFCSPLOWO2_12_FULL_43_24]HBM36593.1 hypothetical protein [Sulfuricurvum sp.]